MDLTGELGMEVSTKVQRRNGYILLAVLAAVIPLLFLALCFSAGRGEKVRVSVDGAVMAEYPLDEERTEMIEGYEGGYNKLVIAEGYACVSEADCPDGLCVHMGRISRGGQSVVCLPHRVVVEIVSGREGDLGLDTVTR